MAKRIIGFWMLATLLLCYGCGVSPNEYRAFVDDQQNGFTHKLDLALDQSLQIKYKPADYLALQEARGELNAENFATTRAKYDSLMHFEIRMDGDMLKQIKSDTRYKMEYNGGQYFSLKLNDKTLSPVLYQYEGFDAIKPYSSIIIAFEGMEPTDDFELVLQLQELGLQNQAVAFEKDKLNKVPKLKI